MKRPKVDGTSDARFTTGTIGITYHCWTLPSCFSCYVAELLVCTIHVLENII